MSNTKHRITISLNDRQSAVLRSISDYSKQSMSHFIHELIEQSLPVLERMAETFRKIKEVQDEQRRRIVSDLDDAQAAVEPALAHVLDQFDLFMGRIDQAADAAGCALAHQPRQQPDPRPVITGVRSSAEQVKRLASKPVRARKKAVSSTGGIP